MLKTMIGCVVVNGVDMSDQRNATAVIRAVELIARAEAVR
jgi:hypothetical protein